MRQTFFFNFIVVFVSTFLFLTFDSLASDDSVSQAEVENLRYFPVATSNLDDPNENIVSHFDLHLLDKLMQKEGLEAMDPVVLNERRILAVDQVWSSVSLDKFIMVKFGFEPTEKAYLEKLLPMSEGFVFHTKTPLTRTPVAFYFNGFNGSEMNRLKKLIQKSELDQEIASNQRVVNFLSSAVANKINLFFPTVCAQTLQTNSRPPAQVQSQTLTQKLTEPFNPPFSQPSTQPCLASGSLAMAVAVGAQTLPVIIASSALKCFGQIGSGAVSSAKGIWSQIKTAATNPKAFWDSQVKAFSDIKNFLLNIGSELQKFGQQLRGMDPGLLVDMACSMIGQLAPDILSSLAGGGVGLAKLIPRVLSWIARLKNSKTALAALSILKKKGLLNDSSAVLKGILDGKVPISVEGKLAGLATKSPQALNALLSCR